MSQRKRNNYKKGLQLGSGKGQTTNGQLPTTDYQPQTTNNQLPTTNYRLLIINYKVPTTNYKLPTTNYQLQATDHQVQTTNCKQRNTNHQLQVVKLSIYHWNNYGLLVQASAEQLRERQCICDKNFEAVYHLNLGFQAAFLCFPVGIGGMRKA